MTQQLRRSGVLERRVDGSLGVAFGASGCVGCGARGRATPLSLDQWLPATAQAGQSVELRVHRAGLARVAAVLFGLPVLGLAGGAWLGAVIAGERLSTVLGPCGFVFGVLCAACVGADRLVAWLGPRIRLSPPDAPRPTNGRKL